MSNLLRQGGAAAVFLIGAIALSGCQTVGSYQPDIAFTGDQDSLVLVSLPEFKKTPSRHVVFTDIWQREEYALFQGEGAQAEIMYAAADERDNVVLGYYLTVERMVNTWNIARKHSLSWGATGRLASTLGEYFYRRFQLSNANRNCVGFHTEWDLRVEDTYGRHSKALFGYYCGRPGDALSDEKIADVIGNVWIRGITERYARFTPVPPSGPGTSRSGAVQFAKTGTGETGNASFPFDMAEYFQESEEDDTQPLNN